MISGLRGIGLPAAYVSGYLRTVPKAGVPGLQGPTPCMPGSGSGAARRPAGTGSIPTNAVLAGDDHSGGDRPRLFRRRAGGGVVFASGRQKIDEAVSVMPVRADVAPHIPGRTAAGAPLRPS